MINSQVVDSVYKPISCQVGCVDVVAVDRPSVDEKFCPVIVGVLTQYKDSMTVDELAAELKLDTDEVLDRVHRDGDTVSPVE